MKRPRRGHRWDKHPLTPAKVKRYLRALRRNEVEAFDARFPDTERAERITQLHRALRRRRAKNKVAKQSRRRNR